MSADPHPSSSQSSHDDNGTEHHGHQIYDGVLSGAQDRPWIPRLRSDPPPYHPLSQSLNEFRQREGRDVRKQRLKETWERLPSTTIMHIRRDLGPLKATKLTREEAQQLEGAYEEELLGQCNGKKMPGKAGQGLHGAQVSWKEFKKYAEDKEAELWSIFHNELDLDGNGHLDAEELSLALKKADIILTPKQLSDFMLTLTSSTHSQSISFREFRDFLLLLPRKASPAEIYRFYEVQRYMGDDGRGAARVTMEGDVSLSAEDKPPDVKAVTTPLPDPIPPALTPSASVPVDHEALDEVYEEEDEEEEEEAEVEGMPHHTALRFLAAGGVAGAVSRTCTAPLDRLKIFLITRAPDHGSTSLPSRPGGVHGIKLIASAVVRIYSEGGVLAFWTGNGLSIAKIFPESAIKFMTYESAKRAFAKYWDKVDDPRDISGSSRFLSGGLGGICSQLSIYPIETLKTQMMSNTGDQKRSLPDAVRRLWALGGPRAFYRGLTIGLIGVFPYSAIDMSTFEALKLAYVRSTGKPDEPPGVLATLAFGSVSGSVGATSVYPLNLVRTRLQASGSPGHPQKYDGIWDVVQQTYVRDGWRGFYRGLFPTLAKVVPAVSISYVVYEHSKRKLGV